MRAARSTWVLPLSPAGGPSPTCTPTRPASANGPRVVRQSVYAQSWPTHSLEWKCSRRASQSSSCASNAQPLRSRTEAKGSARRGASTVRGGAGSGGCTGGEGSRVVRAGADSLHAAIDSVAIRTASIAVISDQRRLGRGVTRVGEAFRPVGARHELAAGRLDPTARTLEEIDHRGEPVVEVAFAQIPEEAPLPRGELRGHTFEHGGLVGGAVDAVAGRVAADTEERNVPRVALHGDDPEVDLLGRERARSVLGLLVLVGEREDHQ